MTGHLILSGACFLEGRSFTMNFAILKSCDANRFELHTDKVEKSINVASLINTIDLNN